jgi:LuxR family maltose regulon positive regulatory protein
LDDHRDSTRRAGVHASPILATKLHRPSLNADLVPRAHLLERLDCNRLQPLTLISASPGYGKSTLASMWLQAIDCASAWVSLDEGDNDLRTFITYVLAAVRNAFPAANLKTQALLDIPVLPPVPVLARYLLNDLDRIQESFVLALDDLHLIREQAIYDLLGELLRHPSRTMHLLLTSRRDPPLPIATLRARSQILEIRATDLRFAPSETAHLLRLMLHRDVSDDSAADWTQRTEGWVTALQLAALALRRRGQPEHLNVDFQVGAHYLQEYLLAEVLAHLTPTEHRWLTATCLLDRFSAPLCDAVCLFGAANDENDWTGEGFLRWLRADNLFLIPLDDQHLWFRFHHLFQELLQQALHRRARTEEVAAVHRRASRWFTENGWTDEAIQHAVAAGDVTGAVELVVRHRYDLMNTEQWHRLQRWLRLLPEDIVAQNPYLMSAIAYMGVFSSRDQDMVRGTRQAESLLATCSLEAEESRVVHGEVAVVHGVLDLLLGQPTSAIANGQRGLNLLPAEALHIRAIASTLAPIGRQMLGEFGQSVELFREILSDPVWPENILAKLLSSRCVACFVEGDLAGVLAAARECLRISQKLGLAESTSYARHFLGVTHYLRNELAEAEPFLLALLDDRLLAAPSYLASGASALALIHLSRGDVMEAERVVEQERSHFHQTGNAFALAIAESCRVELALRQGRLDEARRMSAGVEFGLRPPSWFFYIPQLTPIKLLLADGSPEGLAAARASLEALDEQMRRIHRKTVRIDVLSLLALVCEAQGETSAANAALTEALLLAEPGGFVRNFADLGQPMAGLLARLQRQAGALQPSMMRFVSRLLAAFPTWDLSGARTESSPDSFKSLQAQPKTRDSLTKRELQVLKLLATDMPPEEIAGELVVSTSTVRTHIKNIYTKLDVHSRMEALHRADVLRLQ